MKGNNMSKFLICKELHVVMIVNAFKHSSFLVEYARRYGLTENNISDEEIVDVFEHYWNNKREEEWMDYVMG